MPRPPKTAPGRVLFVDDEEDLERLIRKAFRRRIRRGELDVVFAHNGREALELLAEDPTIDVVFSDINMPVMGGLSLLSEIKRADRKLRTIIVSAYNDMENIREAMNRGAFDFLTKPIDLNDLEVTLDKTLQQVSEFKAGEEARRLAAALEQRVIFVRETFGRYVSEEVVTAILDSPEGLQLGGERRRVSVLMIDLRGFTAISERLPPETVVAMLNRYIETVVDVAVRFGGTVNSISGDGVMVIFGAPISHDDSAARALACGIAMQQAIVVVNQKNEDEGAPLIRAGVGINTGEVVVGNIGSRQRATYTAIGIHVNIAARIESYAAGGQVLISEATRAEVGDIVTITRSIQVRPKGLKDPITLHVVEEIGGDFGLKVPTRDDELKTIAPQPIAYALVTDKKSGDQLHPGELVGLSSERGELRPAGDAAVLSSLRMFFRDGAGAPIEGEVYCKVLEVDKRRDRLLVSFTSIDPAAASIFKRLLPRG